MKKAFTLVEILLVVVIIGLIAAIAIPSYTNFSSRNNIAKAKGGLRALQIAVENYYLYNNSQYPAALSDLTTAVPNIVKTIPKDPFSPSDSVFGYSVSSNKKYYAIYSVGSEGGGSASVNDSGVLSESGSNCIYVSNIQEDTQP